MHHFLDNHILADSLVGSNFPLQASCNVTCSMLHFCHGLRYSKQKVYVFLYTLMSILGTSLLSNGISIGASIGYEVLSEADRFGRLRVYGTVGYGISAFIASRFYEYFETEYVYIYMFIITTVITALITSFIRVPTNRHVVRIDDEQEATTNLTVTTKEEMMIKKNKHGSFISNVLVPLLTRIDVCIFLSTTFIWGMSFSGIIPVGKFLIHVHKVPSSTILLVYVYFYR